MAELLHKFAQVLLLLFCLTPTDIESKTKILATVEGTSTLNGRQCIAVWFSKNCLLTAASCFDELGKRNFTKNPHIDVIINYWSGGETEYYYQAYRSTVKRINEQNKTYKGEAIVHPQYNRKDKITFAYDLAVVRVKKSLLRWNARIKLCPYDSNAKKWTVFVKDNKELEDPSPGSKDRERKYYKDDGHLVQFPQIKVHQAESRYFAVVPNGQMYYIDSRKQFTSYSISSDQKQQFPESFDFLIGGPVLDDDKSCVAGIVNFVGEKSGKRFITSTKVYPVRQWIEFTRQYLKKAKGKRRGDKIYGTERDSIWEKNKINLDPIGPSNASERQAGNLLSNTDLKEVEIPKWLRRFEQKQPQRSLPTKPNKFSK